MIVNTTVNKEKSANLLCTDSELYFKEVECDITLPTQLSQEYSDIRKVWDMLHYDGKLYMLVYDSGSPITLYLYIYDGTSWTNVSVESGATCNDGNLQELNGVIYIAYTKPTKYWRICKYENGAIVEVVKQATSNDVNCCLIKDYDNNILYLVKGVNDTSVNYCYYQSFDGTTLGESILWSYDNLDVTLQGAFIKNNLMYISAQIGSSYNIVETKLTDVSGNLRHIMTSTTKAELPKMTKKIGGEYISTATGNAFIHLNKGLSLVNHLCAGIAFTEYEDGILICEMKNKPSVTHKYKTLKKIKLYRELHTYGEKGDLLQFSSSFAISDNLRQIDEHTYEVTVDGEVKIGIY